MTPPRGPWRFRAELWRWPARHDTWIFVRLPVEASDEIGDLPLPPRGFASVPVRVTCGSTTWATSIFRESADGCYTLPLKQAVRRAEGLGEGDVAEFTLELH
ncbi:DUF1905 domain-containing protein [Kineococcus gynurae]|uniref:DUF1905 domain-containing protein n=1 Tax=Kineococcus gynurae TaxID=452979 RepID=A0ABV5LP39_9ACTN